MPSFKPVLRHTKTRFKKSLIGLTNFLKSKTGFRISVIVSSALVATLSIGGLVYGYNQLLINHPSLPPSPHTLIPVQVLTQPTTDPSTPTSVSTTSENTAQPKAPSSAASSNCTKTNIIPYTTTYSDAPYLAVGQTDSSGGTDGYTYVCTANGGYKSSDDFPPINKTVYVGTGQTQADKDAAAAVAAQTLADQAARTAANARNDRIATCIRSVRAMLGAVGASGSSDLDNAISQCYSTP